MSNPKILKRHGAGLKFQNNPDGSYSGGLSNSDFANQLGVIASYWPHLEEQMIGILGQLLGDGAPARQVFRAIIAQNARIKVMKALLERTARNKTKGSEYDEIISEFASLNDLRNTYIHGLWHTHETGRVFFSESSIDDGHIFAQRELLIEELQNATIRMGNLWVRVTKLLHPDIAQYYTEKPLLEIPPLKPAVENP